MQRYRLAVGTLVLIFWFAGLALTLTGSDIAMPWSLHVAAVGVLGWALGPLFWEGLSRGGPGDRGAGSGGGSGS